MGPLNTLSQIKKIPGRGCSRVRRRLAGVKKLITGQERLMKSKPPAMGRSGDSSCCYQESDAKTLAPSGGDRCRGKNRTR